MIPLSPFNSDLFFFFWYYQFQHSKYCVFRSVLSTFSNMQTIATTSLPSPYSFSLFRHCLLQRCLLAMCGIDLLTPLSLNMDVLAMGTPSATVCLQTLPALHCFMPICKCLFASCPLAFFPSLQWWVLSCDVPLKINVRGKGRYSSSVPTYQIRRGEHVFLGQECFFFLLAAFFHTDL